MSSPKWWNSSWSDSCFILVLTRFVLAFQIMFYLLFVMDSSALYNHTLRSRVSEDKSSLSIFPKLRGRRPPLSTLRLVTLCVNWSFLLRWCCYLILWSCISGSDENLTPNAEKGSNTATGPCDCFLSFLECMRSFWLFYSVLLIFPSGSRGQWIQGLRGGRQGDRGGFRGRPPQQLTQVPSPSPYLAFSYGASCTEDVENRPQPFINDPYPYKVDENCLFLNIFTPDVSSDWVCVGHFEWNYFIGFQDIWSILSGGRVLSRW